MKIIWKCKTFSELSIEDLYDLMVLRQKVFILEQKCPYLDADGKDYSSHHLLGYYDDTLIAYLRLVQPGVSYSEISFGRIVTAKSERGKGVGKLLMREGLLRCRALYGDQPIRISAQKYLKSFYQSFHFHIVGNEYLEDGIPHVEMIRE